VLSYTRPVPPLAPGFSAMRARSVLRLLQREFGYTVVRRSGSHRILKAPDRPRIIFAFHDKDEVGPSLLRDILVKQVGLSLEEAKEVVSRA
jgi:predicted RNA binding protein YcfA (HicA-like mRNA interferase family)